MGTVRVAMCQTVCLDGDRKGNLARAERAVAEAAAGKAEIVCLPEMAIYGWVNPDAHERAHPIPGADSDRLCELAARYGVFLCAGLAEKDGKHLHDSAILIDSEGRILSKHRKINILAGLMTPAYTPGRDITVAETKFGRVGLLICADTHSADILASMMELRPAFVIVPYGYAAVEDAWPEHGKALEEVVANAAKTIGAPVVGTNLIGQITHGPWTGRTYAGHSVAADKTGKIVATANDFDPDVKVVTLTLD
ncbi:MAG: carbon-nitrogen hydrolase family protein [Planctomycetota bacterium]|nr:carbon-nitrogen hydrolase family protein [Planctomycetota bacterium]